MVEEAVKVTELPEQDNAPEEVMVAEGGVALWLTVVLAVTVQPVAGSVAVTV